MSRSKMWCLTLSLSALIAGGIAVPAVAQEGGSGEMSPEMAAAMEAWAKSMTPGSRHEALAKQAGSYKVTVTTWMAPDAPPTVTHGTAERSMILGGRVMVEKFQGDMMGMPFEGVGHTGYDNVTGEYWATWNDNFGTGVTVLKGTVDLETHASVFEGMTSDPMSGGQVKMRIEGRVEGGKEIDSFFMPGPTGEVVKGMEIVYERQ